MRLFWLLQSSLKAKWTRVLIIAGAAGVMNAAILGVLNAGAFAAANQTLSLRYLLLFLICMSGFYMAKRYAILQGSQGAEKVLRDILIRLMDKVRRSELPVVERIVHEGTYHRIANDTTVISQATLFLINAAQQSIVLLMCMLYIAVISPTVFIIALVGIGLGVLLYQLHMHGLIREITEQKDAEASMVNTLDGVFDGFKEVRLNERRSTSIRAALDRIADRLYQSRVRTNSQYCTEMMFADVVFYMLLGTIAFILPQYQHSSVHQILMSAAAILFIMGPLQGIVSASPIFLRASSAIEHLEELEEQLDQGLAASAAAGAPEEEAAFHSIGVKDIVYRYPAVANGEGTPTDSFQIGPFSLEVRQGETVFLVGGNGSGKTTLLKVLTGLYAPTQGSIQVDGQPVTADQVAAYRNRFSAIFSDFHLFDRLYGYEQTNATRVNELLQLMGIADKTAYQEGRFTSLRLSTGQRKRLAMVVALLEDRDILVLDEWAADQDPHFRAYFYEKLLTDLKNRGKTIIAVSHDERYWHLADRVVRMEYGELAAPNPQGQGSRGR